MGFDINKFAEGFKKTVGWMLGNRCAQQIKDDLQFYKKIKNCLEKNPDSLDALKIIIHLIKTNGYHFELPQNFESVWENFCTRYGTNFRSPMAKKEIVSLVGTASWKKSRVEDLTKYDTLKEFTDELYDLAKYGKTKVLGEKGRDEYLRDVGYWGRIPMDRHERRFIIRSGIYHSRFGHF